PTKYTKIVVTDGEGRYAIPDLPKAKYSVWVRGYGLVDGQKQPAAPGSTLNLTAGREASPKEAAEIYPSMYWFSLLKVPAARDISRLDGERAIANFADWTDRIATGELPFDRPRRPQGLERNLVITMWDYLAPQFYLHDLVSTDRRNPRVNPHGAVYGSPEDS